MSMRTKKIKNQIWIEFNKLGEILDDENELIYY